MLRREVIRLTAREPVRRDFRFVNRLRDAARGGTRNIEQHKARIEREVKLGLRRPPKDPGSRP